MALLGSLSALACTLLVGPLVRGLPAGETVRTLIVLGSGGHTAEMLRLLPQLVPGNMYGPLHFVVAATDHMSRSRAEQLLSTLSVDHPGVASARFHSIRRSREVGQSYTSSIWTTLVALVDAVRLVCGVSPELLICNGPGTCIPICAVAVARSVAGLQRCKLVYVESVARVHSLSLSARIIYHLRWADALLVQWPQLHERYPRTTYIGRLY